MKLHDYCKSYFLGKDISWGDHDYPISRRSTWSQNCRFYELNFPNMSPSMPSTRTWINTLLYDIWNWTGFLFLCVVAMSGCQIKWSIQFINSYLWVANSAYMCMNLMACGIVSNVIIAERWVQLKRRKSPVDIQPEENDPG